LLEHVVEFVDVDLPKVWKQVEWDLLRVYPVNGELERLARSRQIRHLARKLRRN
jgi:hypothetical protein